MSNSRDAKGSDDQRTNSSDDEGDRKPAAKEYPKNEPAKLTDANFAANRGGYERLPSDKQPIGFNEVRATESHSDSGKTNNDEEAGRLEKKSTAAVLNGKSTIPLVVAKDPESSSFLSNGNDKAVASTIANTSQMPRQKRKYKKRAKKNTMPPLPNIANLVKNNKSKRRKFNADRQMEDLEKETRELHFNHHTERLQKTRVKSFGLKFNDVSVAAICKWTGGSLDPDANQVRQSMPAPSVDVNFRFCSICRCWGGHYEVECPKIDRAHTMRFAREIKATTKTETEDAPVEVELGPVTVVEVEECDGFLIEQREVPSSRVPRMPKSALRKIMAQQNEHSKPMEMILDSFVIKASGTGIASSLASSEKAITAGDLVFWFTEGVDSDSTDASDSRTVNTGTVIRCNEASGKALVRYLVAIPPSPASTPASNHSFSVGTTHLIPMESLVVANEERLSVLVEPPESTISRKKTTKRYAKSDKSRGTPPATAQVVNRPAAHSRTR
jgi:hypothetical protein